MFSEEIAVGVEEVGVRGFQNPGILAVVGFAGVDLIAFGVNGEEGLLTRGRLKLWRNLLCQRGECGDGEEGKWKVSANAADHRAQSPLAVSGRRKRI